MHALNTDPVVSAHGVEAVGAADKDQIVVSGNKHFDEVVALVLETDTQHGTVLLRGGQLPPLPADPVCVT